MNGNCISSIIQNIMNWFKNHYKYVQRLIYISPVYTANMHVVTYYFIYYCVIRFNHEFKFMYKLKVSSYKFKFKIHVWILNTLIRLHKTLVRIWVESFVILSGGRCPEILFVGHTECNIAKHLWQKPRLWFVHELICKS